MGGVSLFSAHRLPLLIGLVFGGSCAEDGNVFDDGTTAYVSDQDGDGSPEGKDCDDENPDVNPQKREICENGIDDNCDGHIDSRDADCPRTGDTNDTAWRGNARRRGAGP